MPTHLQVDRQAGDRWTSEEYIAAMAATVMVLESAGGPPVQRLRIVRSLRPLPGIGAVGGHLDPETGVITLNAGSLTGAAHPQPLPAIERLSRIILTAAHEAVHAVQRHAGHALPSDQEAVATYDTDPWYEVEARTVSVEVLKGRWPKASGSIPMGPTGRQYAIPDSSRFREAWERLEGGPWWSEEPVLLPLPETSLLQAG